MRKITGIMACDKQYVIAKEGKLPWNCPQDVCFYKKMINNEIVIMGYKTYQQMPASFFENHTAAVVFSNHIHDTTNPLVSIVSSLAEFFALKNLPKHKQCYMIGGSEIATLFLKNKAIDDFYLSEIDGYYPGDVFFPMDLIKNHPRTVYLKGSDFTVYHYRHLKA